MSDMKSWIQLVESASKAKYTGRETKQGTWHVFQTGESVAAAGPFKSAQEANEWIRSQETTNEAHGNSKIYDKCWDGYRKVPGKRRGEKGSCVKEDEHQSSDLDRSLGEDSVTESKAVTWTSGHKPDKEYVYAVHIDGEEEGTYHSLEQAKRVVANRKKTTPHRKYKIKRMKRTGAYTHEGREVDELRKLAGLNENYGVPGQPEQTGSMSISKQEGDVTVNISAHGADMAELMAIMRKYGGEEEHVGTPCGHDEVTQPDRPVDEIAPAMGAIAGGVARAGASMAARSLGDTLRDKLGMNQNSDQG